MLFVFRKIGGEEWKIARYCFSTTTPPPPKQEHVEKANSMTKRDRRQKRRLETPHEEEGGLAREV